MTIIIAHRGNLKGPSKDENSIKSIEEAISLGFHVEIDIWYKNNNLFLGHDNPQQQIHLDFLRQHKDKLWVHCKNLESLHFLTKTNEQLEYFWHQNDDFTLTKSNLIWTFPDKGLTENSIAVMPSNVKNVLSQKPFGICTDYPIEVKEILASMTGKL